MTSFGNSIDISYFANWTIVAAAGGYWLGNEYFSALAGTWNITASLGISSCMTTLNVNHASPVNINISPANFTIMAGQTQLFNGTANDLYGNPWDVTASIVWNIDSHAGGFWIGDIYTAAKAGNWAVTATLGNLASFTTLNVTHSSAQSILVTPQTALINAGCSQVFNSTAFDLYNNSWDISTLASWSINSSAAGSWSVGNYTSANMGNWTVTVDYNGLKSFSELTVYYPNDLNPGRQSKLCGHPVFCPHLRNLQPNRSQCAELRLKSRWKTKFR